MITNKTHNKILSEEKNEVAKIYQKRIDTLTEELKEARDLKLILEKLYPMREIFSSIGSVCNGNVSLNLPDTVLQYTEDILGGKVIKQEGIKCLVVEKDGTVKTGLTKQKADKNYNYKLVRE